MNLEQLIEFLENINSSDSSLETKVFISTQGGKSIPLEKVRVDYKATGIDIKLIHEEILEL